MKRRTWTLPELRRIRERRLAGEPWATIQPDYGVTVAALRRALNRNGLGIGLRGPKDDRRDEATILEATRLRNDQWTWPAIVEELNWPLIWDALRRACHVSARQKGGSVWCGKGVVR